MITVGTRYYEGKTILLNRKINHLKNVLRFLPPSGLGARIWGPPQILKKTSPLSNLLGQEL